MQAAKRSTTVYLTNRRIDMVPPVLSSNICSLRGEEERFAVSTVWEMNPDTAEVVSVEFFKSVIKSKSAMMYSDAQQRIDDTKDQTSLTKSLRQLNALAKKLKKKRLDRGALMLASPEVRFNMESETHDPVDVEVKQAMDTHSLVEEFMLLANVTVAQKIFDSFPACKCWPCQRTRVTGDKLSRLLRRQACSENSFAVPNSVSRFRLDIAS
eukprot:m.624316 g.624316  ORF g.624316 m.624316 type:complete len:211 (-) comp22545_c0_seq79:2021-2653(-)